MPGDRVLSRHEDDVEGAIFEQEVVEVFRRSSWLLRLTIDDRTIDTTPEHPFFVRDRGWTSAGELKAGDQLASLDGDWLSLQHSQILDQDATVYNVSIHDFHTYFVGEDSWRWSVWSHNSTDLTCNAIKDFRKQHDLDPVTKGEGQFKGTVAVIHGKNGTVIGVNSDLVKGRKVFKRQKLTDEQVAELQQMIAKHPNWYAASPQVQSAAKTVAKHAEATALYKAWVKNGRKPLGEITIHSDRTLCSYACQPYLHTTFTGLGVSKLTVIDRNGGRFVGDATSGMLKS